MHKSFLLFLFLFGTLACNANVSLPDVLGDSMVLQQRQSVPVWGDADPGESVTVNFAGVQKTTTANANGKWRLSLGKFTASSEPRSMTIAGHNTIILTNILVGEVWLVAGQSNMQRLLRETNHGDEVASSADHPNIRLFNVSREVGFKHKEGKLGKWAPCSPLSVSEFSAVGYYFGLKLSKELHIPIGLINASYGGSQAEAWTPTSFLNASADLKPTVERTDIWAGERDRVRIDYADAIKKWRDNSDKAMAAGAKPSPSPSVPDALREYRIASSIYDAMIEPLIPFAIRGAAWYQGESNELRAEQYNILLPTMIRAWRERWGEGDFPFEIIQLPNYRATKTEPENAPWSFIREAQRRTVLKTVNTGLIVTIDLGEAGDIHPKNKIDVGERMARWALRHVYGRKLTDPPMLRSFQIRGSRIFLTFDSVGTGLRILGGDKLREFAIAGADEKWVWADARIVAKDQIEVSAPEIRSPKAVRYAFNSNPRQPNLTNDSLIPASPFRTDDWTDPTAGIR